MVFSWLYKKINPTGYWKREIFKKSRFKKGDYIKATKEVYDRKTHQHVEKEFKGQIVDLRLDERSKSVMDHLASSEYIYTENGLTYKLYDIESADEEWQLDPETKGAVGFNKDLKDLLK